MKRKSLDLTAREKDLPGHHQAALLYMKEQQPEPTGGRNQADARPSTWRRHNLQICCGFQDQAGQTLQGSTKKIGTKNSGLSNSNSRDIAPGLTEKIHAWRWAKGSVSCCQTEETALDAAAESTGRDEARTWKEGKELRSSERNENEPNTGAFMPRRQRNRVSQTQNVNQGGKMKTS
jgi:hypothetical protein